MLNGHEHKHGQSRRGRQGYSLVELLLTMSLLVLFTSLAVLSLDTLSQKPGLTEGSTRFETLLRFARAEAAQTGKRVRINFVQDTNQAPSLTALNHVELTWEPDPLGEPDVFQDFQASQWGIDQVNQMVGVETVKLADNADPQPGGDEATDPDETGDASPVDANSLDASPLDASPLDAEPFAPASITFNPNGSCDSAQITLADRASVDDRRIVVKIEGFTGSISRVELPDKEAGAETQPQQTDRRATPPESSR